MLCLLVCAAIPLPVNALRTALAADITVFLFVYITVVEVVVVVDVRPDGEFRLACRLPLCLARVLGALQAVRMRRR